MSRPSEEAFAPSARWMDKATPPHILTLVLMAGLGALNMNVMLPSIAGIAESFEADYALAQLTISAYLAVTGALQLIVGPLSDRFGRRPVVLWSLWIFLVSTIGCLLAPDIYIFLAFRMVSGTVAIGFVLSRAIVRDLVGMDKAAAMIGWVTMGMTLVPMIGPAIGGIAEEAFGWRATVGLTLAFGLITTAIIHYDLGETNRARSASLTAQFRQYPDLVTSRRFWGYVAVAAFASGAFFAFLGGSPFVARVVLGMSPSALGFYFAFIAVGYALGNMLSGMYAERVGVNPMMLMGTLVAVSGIAISIVLFLAGGTHPLTLFLPMLLTGLGNGLTLPSANAGMVSVRPRLAGSASGLGGAVMIGGGAAFSAITGALLTEETGAYPLLFMMLGSSLLSALAAIYVIVIARMRAREAALEENLQG